MAWPGAAGKVVPVRSCGTTARCHSRFRSARRRSPSTRGRSILVTEPDGRIAWPSDKGLYFFDTRLISAWAVYANGETWELLSGGAVTYDTARLFLTNNDFVTEDGEVPARSLGFMLSRALDGGLHEDMDLTNHSPKPVRFNLEVAIRCDFADIFEVKRQRIIRRGHITTAWSEPEQRLSTVYRNRDFMRAITVRAHESDSRAVFANGRISFEISLAPGATWHCCLLYDLTDGERRFPAPLDCAHHTRRSAHAHADATTWRQTVPRLQTSNEEFYRFYSPGAGRHGGAAPADAGHRRRGAVPRRGPAVVRGAVRPRQPDRLVADHADRSRLRAWRAGGAGPAAGHASATTGAMPSRARSRTRCATASWRISS